MIKKIKLGPGVLITSAFIGPGTVTICLLSGVNTGLKLLWAVIFSTIATIILQDMCVRLGYFSKKGLEESVFTNFDIGTRWFSSDRSMATDISLYRLEGKDEVISFSTQPGRSEPRNAGETRHQGVEFGWRYTPDSLWDATLNGTLARHSYEDYQTSSTLNFSGNEIPAAPHWLSNAEIGYKALTNLRLSAEMQGLGSYYMDNSNSVKYAGHALLNLRARYSLRTMDLWVALLNASNKHYAEIAASTYNGSTPYNPDSQNTYTPGAPRTALIGINYHFGEK